MKYTSTGASEVMDETKKPPLGVKPAWLVAEGRIVELSSALNRYAQHCEKSEISIMRMWAEEIIMQCNIIEKMEALDEKRMWSDFHNEP